MRKLLDPGESPREVVDERLDEALDEWKRSPAHTGVILNRTMWASYRWGAIGVGIVGGHASVWFGIEADPAL